jgi:hypothetical protein
VPEAVRGLSKLTRRRRIRLLFPDYLALPLSFICPPQRVQNIRRRQAKSRGKRVPSLHLEQMSQRLLLSILVSTSYIQHLNPEGPGECLKVSEVYPN